MQQRWCTSSRWFGGVGETSAGVKAEQRSSRNLEQTTSTSSEVNLRRRRKCARSCVSVTRSRPDERMNCSLQESFFRKTLKKDIFRPVLLRQGVCFPSASCKWTCHGFSSRTFV